MCFSCYEREVAEAGGAIPTPVTNEMRRAVLLIDAIYYGADRTTGGHLHAELDDDNLGDELFEAPTLEEAKPYILEEHPYRIPVLDVERWCYLCLKGLTYEERVTAHAIHHRFVQPDALMDDMLEAARDEQEMAEFWRGYEVDEALAEWPDDVRRLAGVLRVSPRDAAAAWLAHSASWSAGWLTLPPDDALIRERARPFVGA